MENSKEFRESWCGRTDAGMSFICENHNFYEDCEIVAAEFDPNYSVTVNAGLPWQEARDACLEKGDGWDLAVPNSLAEMNHLVDLAKCHAGQRENLRPFYCKNAFIDQNY